MEIEIKLLTLHDITDNVLDGFQRIQTVTRAWRRENGLYALKDVNYTKDWDDKQRQSVVNVLKRCAKNGGTVIAAYVGVANANLHPERPILAGFTCLEGKGFGKGKLTVEMGVLHISAPYRGKGIGARLFETICAAAKEKGFQRVYLSAHSSEEAIGFYRKQGCKIANPVNRGIAVFHPMDDIQMMKEL
jgi:GNAT superfamily N-acetyltransferase